MNYKGLQTRISAKTGLSNEEVDVLVQSLEKVMLDEIKSGKTVNFQGFGSFELKQRKERQSVNPMTQKRTIVPAKQVIAFKVSGTYKDKIKELS
ncbi:MAG: HU family DNA-binding protein [Paludibacteraceae bacterium]|nr:HU family DNA-binding protein [Paludibacteraceae bacterium]